MSAEATRAHPIEVRYSNMTMDRRRSIALPCWRCETADVPRTLVEIGRYTRAVGGGNLPGDKIERPMCPACVAAIGELAIAASQAVVPLESVAVVWRDEDGSARAIVSGIKLLVYRCGQWRWEVSIFDGLIDRWCDGGEPMCVGLPTIDAAKAAAIAAARAWRDSIRL